MNGSEGDRDRSSGGAGTPPEEHDLPAAREPRRIADRADFDPAYDPDAPIVCDVCGGIMPRTHQID